MRQTAGFCLLLSFLFIQNVQAQIPENLSYQGVLKDDQGNLVDGTRDLTFKLYDSDTGGTPLWELTFSGVPVNGGIFNVTLAGGSPDLGTLAFNQAYWMGISVGSDPELSPRIPLTATPYSLNARIAPGTVVTSVNGLKDDVTIEAGTNVTIVPDGNKLTISAAAGGGGGSGGVSGSGEDNFLAKWSDSNSLIKASVFEDDSGQVGIGTQGSSQLETANTVFLQVGPRGEAGTAYFRKDGAVTIGRNSEGSGVHRDARFLVDGGDSRAFVITKNSRVAVGTGDSDDLRFMESDNLMLLVNSAGGDFQNAFFVKADGSVGIGGSTLSNHKLWVQGRAGGTAPWNSTSDRRFKTDIETISSALAKVRSLRGVRFTRINGGGGKEIGFIAQEVEPVVPDVVSTDSEGYKSIQYGAMVSVLVEAMKEMDAEVKRLHARIEELEKDR